MNQSKKVFVKSFVAWLEIVLTGVTVHGENVPILGFMRDLSDYLVKNRKKSLIK